MLKNKLHIFDSPHETAEAVAELMAEKIHSKNDFFYLAVSGGNTPKILFEILAKKYAGKIDWEKLKIFWVDERCVPPMDKESNYGMTYESLLKYVPIPEENVFRMQGENEPSYAETIRYRKILEKELPVENGLPVFDMVLLGMGDDGHTASIFSANMDLIHSPETVETAIHPQSGQQRITLTGNTILNATKILFLVTGDSKAAVLKEILTDENRKYPSYHILANSTAELYVDKQAARLL